MCVCERVPECTYSLTLFDMQYMHMLTYIRTCSFGMIFLLHSQSRTQLCRFQQRGGPRCTHPLLDRDGPHTGGTCDTPLPLPLVIIFIILPHPPDHWTDGYVLRVGSHRVV